MALRFISSGDAQRMITTFGIRPVPTLETIEEIRDAVDVAILAIPMFTAANILNGWTYDGFQVVRTTATGEESIELSFPVVGSLVGAGFTTNTAVLISKRTGLGGRRHRGRMFFPPMLFSDIGADNNGFLSPALHANLTTSFEGFRQEFIDAGVPMVLHHSGVALDSQLVTQLFPSNQLATQRRRMR